MTGTVAVANFGNEYVHRKDEENKDYVQVAHEEEEVIIITPSNEAITATNEVLLSKKEELITVDKDLTEK